MHFLLLTRFWRNLNGPIYNLPFDLIEKDSGSYSFSFSLMILLFLST